MSSLNSNDGKRNMESGIEISLPSLREKKNPVHSSPYFTTQTFQQGYYIASRCDSFLHYYRQLAPNQWTDRNSYSLSKPHSPTIYKCWINTHNSDPLADPLLSPPSPHKASLQQWRSFSFHFVPSKFQFPIPFLDLLLSPQFKENI